MSRGLLALVVLAIVVVGAVYIGSPFYAFHELKAAAEAGDRERLEAMVDFPAVREDLKRQVDSGAVKLARRASGVGYPIAAVIGALGAALGDSAIDRLVTPDSIGAMIRFGETSRGHHKHHAEAATAAGDTTPTAPESRTVVHYGFLTPDRFRVSVAPAADTDHPIDLILERHGLFSWRLEAIQLPK